MPKIVNKSCWLLCAAALSVVIDVLAIVGWCLSLLWAILLITWMLKTISNKNRDIQRLIVAVCVPLAVYIFSKIVEMHIDSDLISISNNITDIYPADKKDFLTNSRFKIGFLTRSRILFYRTSEQGPIIVLRSFPFNVREYNLTNRASKVRAYD